MKNTINKLCSKIKDKGILKTLSYSLKKGVSYFIRPNESIEKPNVYIRLYANHVKRKYSNFQPERNLPRVIQIQTITGCNFSCVFCPVNKKGQVLYGGARNREKMTVPLFEKIINELSAIKYKGRIEPFLMNEPFLDERLIKLVKYTRSKLPEARIRILTNGEVINENTINEVSKYANRLVLNNYPPGKNLNKAIKMEKLTQSVKQTIKIRNYTYKENLSNRAGNVPGNSSIRNSLNLFCHRPFTQMYIAYNGQAVLCCQDWKFEVILGNVKNSSIFDIWCGKEYEKIRYMIIDNKREGLCKKCNYIGYEFP